MGMAYSAQLIVQNIDRVGSRVLEKVAGHAQGAGRATHLAAEGEWAQDTLCEALAARVPSLRTGGADTASTCRITSGWT